MTEAAKRSVRTRIAPSPTGEDIHIGNVYTALVNWAFARKHDGRFIIRIEDTDRERFVPEAQERILATLKSFGLDYDEGPDKGGPFSPYRQSDRLATYKSHAEKLVSSGHAYYCFCSKERLGQMRKDQEALKKIPKYDRYCLINVKNAAERIQKGEPHVVRMKVPQREEIVFTDVIRGEIRINSDQLDDQVLLKSDGYPTYHLGVVVDDHAMEISHVIRAEEWISSTPKHVLLYRFFGWELPVFAHLPILRNPDRTKLSKRKNPVWASWYLNEGYLPQAILNFLALLGWSHPEEKEIFSLSEFTKLFDLKDVHPVGPVFDLKKLSWMNGMYIRSFEVPELAKKVKEWNNKREGIGKESYYYEDEEVFLKIVSLAKERMETFRDFFLLAKHFFVEPKISTKDEKEQRIAKELLAEFGNAVVWDKESILTLLKIVMQKNEVRMPVLYRLLTGEEKGLPLPESLEILGKEKTLARLKRLA